MEAKNGHFVNFVQKKEGRNLLTFLKGMNAKLTIKKQKMGQGAKKTGRHCRLIQRKSVSLQHRLKT